MLVFYLVTVYSFELVAPFILSFSLKSFQKTHIFHQLSTNFGIHLEKIIALALKIKS